MFVKFYLTASLCFFFFLIPGSARDLEFFSRRESCECASDGVSNGIETGYIGCLLMSPDSINTTCVVRSSRRCSRATALQDLPGAAVIPCPAKDAVLQAVELDDLESILSLRSLGVDLASVNTSIDINRTRTEQVTVSSLAATYGSFDVLEDLLINGEYTCRFGLPPEEALCLLSDSEECETNSTERLSILSLINLTYSATCSQALKFERRVNAECGRYPYFVSVRAPRGSSYQHTCGGVLVAKDTVLTAAHCVDTPTSSNPILIVGARTSREGSDGCAEDYEIKKAEKVVIHPKWLKGGAARILGNGKDVAVIKLNSRSRKTPIKMKYKYSLPVGRELYGLGVGRSTQNGGFSTTLQIFSAPVADRSLCDAAYEAKINKDVVCAGDDSGFCEGDEGGPLIKRGSKISKDVLIGTAHLKNPAVLCGERGVPGLYSNAVFLRRWVTKIRKTQF